MKRNGRMARQILASIVSAAFIAGFAGSAASAGDVLLEEEALFSDEAWPEPDSEFPRLDEVLVFEDVSSFASEEAEAVASSVGEAPLAETPEEELPTGRNAPSAFPAPSDRAGEIPPGEDAGEAMADGWEAPPVAAFRAGDSAVFYSEELPFGTNIQAKREPDDSVSASVSWGEMKFIYREAEKSWTADGNTVEVTNTSPHAAILASYSYSPGENGEATMGVFDAEAGAWTIGAESNPTPAAEIGGAFVYTGDPIAAGGTETLWLLFTTDAKVGGLSAEDYTTVGSLSVTVAAA